MTIRQRLFVDQQVLTAAQVNDNLRDITVCDLESELSSIDLGIKAVFVLETRRTYVRQTDTGSTWVFAGGASAPDTVITVNGGWTAQTNRKPRAYKTPYGTVRLIGWFANGGDFTINGTQIPVNIPVGFRPLQSQVFIIPATAGRSFVATVLTNGDVRLDTQLTGATPVVSGTIFFLENIEFSLTYTGA